MPSPLQGPSSSTLSKLPAGKPLRRENREAFHLSLGAEQVVSALPGRAVIQRCVQAGAGQIV